MNVLIRPFCSVPKSQMTAHGASCCYTPCIAVNPLPPLLLHLLALAPPTISRSFLFQFGFQSLYLAFQPPMFILIVLVIQLQSLYLGLQFLYLPPVILCGNISIV